MNSVIENLLKKTKHYAGDLGMDTKILAKHAKTLVEKHLQEVDRTLENDKTITDSQYDRTLRYRRELEQDADWLANDNYVVTDETIQQVKDEIRKINKDYDKWSLDIINLPNSFANVAISAMSKNNVAPASGGKKKTKSKKKSSKKRSPFKKKISRKASKKKTSPKRKSSKKKKR